MPLRINTNVAALNAGRTLNRSTNALNRTLRNLSSGLRINSAADDAAGLAIAEGFSAQARGSAAAQRNAQDGISLVQTAEGALVETTNMLQRMRELAVQAANGTNSNANRTTLQAEVTELISQVDDIAADTEFNGIAVLTDATADITIQSGFKAGQETTITMDGAASAQLGIAAVDISTQAGASAAITTIDTALTNVTNIRSTLGAQQNRLEFTINSLAVQEENALAAESAIRDADMARETISFTRNQILVSAGTSVLAQANIVPQTALTLLG